MTDTLKKLKGKTIVDVEEVDGAVRLYFFDLTYVELTPYVLGETEYDMFTAIDVSLKERD